MYKFDTRETKHRTINNVNFRFLANSQGKLWFTECVQLDVQIRPVFTWLLTFQLYM